MGQMCMTDAGTTQDYFILPAPPVGGLPISQDWLDRMNNDDFLSNAFRYIFESPFYPKLCNVCTQNDNVTQNGPLLID